MGGPRSAAGRMLAGQWEVGAGAMTERVVGLPGRGNTLVWDCPGPPGAPTLMLLPGVTLTAELNWSAVSVTPGRSIRVGAPGGPGQSQTRVFPRPGSPTTRSVMAPAPTSH